MTQTTALVDNIAASFVANIATIQDSYEKLQDIEEFRKSGKFPEALRLCNELVRRFPNYWAAQHTLGLIHSDQGNDELAVHCFVRAAILNPSNVTSLTALAGAYLNLNANQMARMAIDQALALSPCDPMALFMLGEVLQSVHSYEAAAAAYRESLQYDPQMTSTQYKLGLCLLELSDRKAAAEAFQRAIILDPTAIGPVYELASLEPSLVKVDIQKHLDVAIRPTSSTEQTFQSSLSFARAAAFHNRGSFAEAWKHAVAANRGAFILKRAQSEFVAASQTHTLQALRSKETNASYVHKPEAQYPNTLLILGCSRSGKTTLEKMISHLDGVQRGYEDGIVEECLHETMHNAGLICPGSLEYLPKQLYHDFSELYKSKLKQRDKNIRFFTNTNPILISEAARILMLIPNVRIACVKRDLDDVTFCIYMREYQKLNEYAYDIKSIYNHVTWYNSMIDELHRKYPDFVKIYKYEELVSDPAKTLASISSFCSLPCPSIYDGSDVYDDRGCSYPYRDWMRHEAALSHS